MLSKIDLNILLSGSSFESGTYSHVLSSYISRRGANADLIFPRRNTAIFGGDSLGCGPNSVLGPDLNLVGMELPENRLIDYEKKPSGLPRSVHKSMTTWPSAGAKLGPFVQRVLPLIRKIEIRKLVKITNRYNYAKIVANF